MLLHKPFAGMTPKGWRNLALAALALLYIAFALLQILLNGPFAHVGVDFPAFYATASIARERGLGAIYDLQVQKLYQDRVYEAQFGTGWPYGVAPVAYLPLFAALLIPLSFFTAPAAFSLWTIANIVLLAIYLWWLADRVGGRDKRGQVASMLLTLPAFFTVLSGQIDVWLAISVGQSYLAFRERHDFRAGVWMSGLLLKPQMLPLFLAGILIAKRFRVVLGLGLAGLAIAIVSILLVGTEGMVALTNLLLAFAEPNGMATNAPALMMNWRAVAINLVGAGLGGPWAWTIGIIGMFATGLAGIGLWLSPPNWIESHLPEVWLGTLCATFAVTWHSHVHMALPFTALVLILWAEKGRLPSVFTAWLFLPPVVFLAIAFLVGTATADSIIGLVVLTMNLAVLAWAFAARFQVIDRASFAKSTSSSTSRSS